MLIQEFEYADEAVEHFETKLNATQIKTVLASILAPYMWKWLVEHWEDKVFKVKFLIISKTVKVSDLEQLWVFVFGPKPLG